MEGTQKEVTNDQKKRLDMLKEQFVSKELERRGHKESAGASGAIDSGPEKSEESVLSEAGGEEEGQGGPLVWNTGLAEVSLPNDSKWRNIARTAAASERRPYSTSSGSSATSVVRQELRDIHRRDRSTPGGLGSLAANFGSLSRQRADKAGRNDKTRKRPRDANDDLVARKFRTAERNRRNR